MINKLEKKLKIKFYNKDLLLRALTHSSYKNENPTEDDNERLEFLGDAVIELLISKYLYDLGIKEEGELTKRRAQAVCEEALAIYAKHLGLPQFLRVGKGLDAANYRTNPTINADAFEAVFAAVYLDQGYEKVKEVFNNLIVPHLDEVKNIKDYKSTLQELVQTDRKNVVYELINETGPSHNKRFTIVVKLEDKVLGTGTAGTKKEAEQRAAKEALKTVEKEQRKWLGNYLIKDS